MNRPVLSASEVDGRKARVPNSVESALEDTRRVSLREIREHTYRAMVVIGATTGEATLAANAVLHAELCSGTGLCDLLAELSRGPWPAEGLRCVRLPASPPHVQVFANEREGALRLGALLVDFIEGEERAPITVTTDRAVGAGPLLEPPLVRAARESGRPVVAIDPAGDGQTAVLVAEPTGHVGRGWLRRERAAECVPCVRLDGGVSVIGGLDCVEPALRSVLAWTDPADRHTRREEASAEGVRVDARTWSAVGRRARAYLV